MADNEGSVSAVAADTATSPIANLRIITLAHGANRDNDVMLSVPLDLSVGELKGRLTFLIPGSPGAEQQRLIYQGRPLLDNVATMRSVLRLQGGEQITHVLHLVIRTDATSIPTTNQSGSTNEQAGIRPPHSQGSQPRDIPQVPPMPQMANPFPNVLNPAQMAEQANMFQQHMAMHNQHLAALQPGLQHGAFGGIHRPQGIPNAPGQLHPAVPPPSNQFPHHNFQNLPHNTSNAPNGMTMTVQETIGPNGERTRIVTNDTGSFVHHEVNRVMGMNPVERSASAPGMAESTGGPALTQMHRTSQLPFVPGTTRPLPPQNFPLARSRVGPPFQTFQAINSPATTNPTVWLLSAPNGPRALLFAPGHGYFSTTPGTNIAAQNAAGNLGAGAGASAVPMLQQQAPQSTNTSRQPQQQQGERPGNPGVNAQPGAQIVLRPQDQPQPPPLVARNMMPRIRNRNGGDIAAFVLQRGWLFLRLYLFIFVLSAPGSWRRIILLSIATLVCFLPRQNPLTDAFNNARRHFDNLIGPPDLQRPRQPHNAQRRLQIPGEGQPPIIGPANAPGDPTTRHNAMPTPEENARRLLQEHQDRNPSFIRGILRPVEQAVALFLASLIPGVGERHIRAREEARRLAAEEEQRLQTEREEQANQQPDSTTTRNEQNIENSDREQKHETTQTSSSSPDPTEPNTSSASATGVEISNGNGSNSNTGEGVRQRNGENNQPPPNLVADW